MSDKMKLLDCPFCGGEAELRFSNDNKHQPHVVCKFGAFRNPVCPAHNTYGWSYHTVEDAVKAWNSRV